jgi:hypothetical protein
MSFNWVHHEFQLGLVRRTNYGLPVVSPTDLVAEAKRIGGLRGDRNDSEPSLTRNIRDVLAAPLMVNNDRSQLGNARALLVRKEL